MDKNGGLFLEGILCVEKIYRHLQYQVKRKTALLESNWIGIALMTDKNVNQWANL